MTHFPFKIPVKWKYDKISCCWILTCNKYGISGYGKTQTKARKMFKFTLEEILKYKK